MDQFDKFEKRNPKYAINVYAYDDDGFYTLRVCDHTKDKQMIHILRLKNEYTSHYAWIENFNRLMRSEVTKHEHAHEFFYRCFSHFQTKNKLNEHLKDCSLFGAVRIVMPVDEDGTPHYVSFDKFNKQMKCPLIVFADVEFITPKMDTCQPNP